MKTTFVENLRPNARVRDVFLVGEKKMGLSSSNGAPYVHVTLKDRTGAIKAVKWDADLEAFADINQGDYVLAEGLVTIYKDNPQIRLDSCRKYAGATDREDFLPQTSKNIDEMLASVMDLVRSVKQLQLKALLDRFFADQPFLERFKAAPAAVSVHHAYIGGLLEHTLSVAQMCDLISAQYPELDRDLLVAGALLHDIGKTEEIAWTHSIEYTDAGHFVGHVVSGAMQVESAIASIPDFDRELKMKFLHLMLSHHGKREYGAPVLPGTREAIALHYIEDMDAKLKMFEEALADGGKERWTTHHIRFERRLYRGAPDEDKRETKDLAAGEDIEAPDAFADE